MIPMPDVSDMMTSQSKFCTNCDIQEVTGNSVCDSCRSYKRRHNHLPAQDWVDRRKSRLWAAAGGSDRARSVDPLVDEPLPTW